MMRKRWLKVCLLAALPGITGCLRHTRKVQQAHLAGPVMNADLAQLVNEIDQRYNAIQTLSATVEIAPSTGGERQGKQTDYTSFRGYILLRKPQLLRVLGLVPVLRTRMFDLASNGSTFTLLIPPRNRAIEGKSAVTSKSANSLENLRPQFFFDALLTPPIAPNQLVYVSKGERTERNPKTKDLVDTPEYDLHVMLEKQGAPANAPAHEVQPLRIIRFSRVDLLPMEQDVFDDDGNVVTRVLYSAYQNYNGLKYPTKITIERPLESYRIGLQVQKLVVNQPLADNQFKLTIPQGVQVQQLK